MLYFDSQPPHHQHHHHLPPQSTHRSPTRHHFWALLHFPFHTALVLLLEGTSRLITWRNAVELIASLVTSYNAIYNASNSTAVIAANLTAYSDSVLQQVEADAGRFNVTASLQDLAHAGDAGGEVAMDKAMEVLVVLVNATLRFFKIQPAHASASAAASTAPGPDPATTSSASSASSSTTGTAMVDPYTDLGNALIVYDLVFVYFFAAAGITLCLLAIL
ncbi:MAG: hypothetical protein LQ352_005475, partial [Teloschistes flavicans]